jgi:ABC-type multidrug transport system ATPase subunit
LDGRVLDAPAFSPPDDDTVIAFDRVSVIRSGNYLIRGLSWQVELDERWVVLGPNGAGKTTLVEILEGLRAPTSGRVEVLGLEPGRQSEALKRRIGVQLQSTAMPLDLTARELLQMYAAFYGRTLPVADVLKRVGLDAKATTLVRNLSGGQKQRLALGIALIHDPE